MVGRIRLIWLLSVAVLIAVLEHHASPSAGTIGFFLPPAQGFAPMSSFDSRKNRIKGTVIPLGLSFRGEDAGDDAKLRNKETSSPFQSQTRPSPNTKQNSSRDVNAATIKFNHQLNQLAREGSAAHLVEKMLMEVLDESSDADDDKSEEDIQPNVVSFTAVINGFAKSRQKGAAEKADAWLHRFWDLHKEGKVSDKPNKITYNAVLTAYARSRDNKALAGQRAQELLEELWNLYEETGDMELKPDQWTFNSVINTVARSREPGCADKAAALLSRMEDLFKAGHTELLPDNLAFGAIINAYANARSPDSSDKAAGILQEMESLHQLGYGDSVKPNTFVYNSALNCFAKQGDAALASQFLAIMEKESYPGSSIQPDVISYSTTINAWANSNDPKAGEQADALLHKMTQLYLAGGQGDALKPNAICYTAAIKAWAASNTDKSCEQVQKRVIELLELMVLQYLAGDRSQKPTKVTFETVQEVVQRCKLGNEQETLEWIEAVRKRIDRPANRR